MKTLTNLIKSRELSSRKNRLSHIIFSWFFSSFWRVERSWKLPRYASRFHMWISRGLSHSFLILCFLSSLAFHILILANVSFFSAPLVDRRTLVHSHFCVLISMLFLIFLHLFPSQIAFYFYLSVSFSCVLTYSGP